MTTDRRTDEVGEALAYIRAPMLTWMRTEQCLTIREAAGKIGVKPGKWEAWEAGTACPTMEHVWQIQDALRMPHGYLWLSRPPTVPPARHKRWVKPDRRLRRALQEQRP